MSRAVREIRMLGETQLTEAQKEILALSRNFDVVRGWMLGSRIMLEDPAAMERMEFPRWFPASGRDEEQEWTAVPGKGAGAFLAMASLMERKAIEEEGPKGGELRAKAENLLMERLVQPNEAASAGERNALNGKSSITVLTRCMFPWLSLWPPLSSWWSARCSAPCGMLRSGGVFCGPAVSARRGFWERRARPFWWPP